MGAKPDSRHFFMAMVPPTATKQEAKVKVVGGKPRWFPSQAWADAESELRAHLERFRPDEPITSGAVMLSVEWCFPAAGHADGEPYIKKPDTDNLEKGLKDVMTELGWWDDDKRVFSEHATKLHSRIPGIRIDIEVVGEELYGAF